MGIWQPSYGVKDTRIEPQEFRRLPLEQRPAAAANYREAMPELLEVQDELFGKIFEEKPEPEKEKRSS